MDDVQSGRETGVLNAGPEQDGSTAAAPAPAGPSRREFLTGALAVSGLAWSGLLEAAPVRVAAPAAAASAPLLDPQRIGEITRDAANRKLRGTITIRSGQRTLPGQTRPSLMRWLEGKDAAGNVVWPPAPSGPGAPPAVPGPTLRARVGDQVEITFLNHVDVQQFGDSIDRAEQGLTEGCDRVVNGQTGEVWYPDRAGDSDPNCFHGSSSSNLHFHGTHVTPDGLGDNVLVTLRPNLAVTEDTVRDDFNLIFQAGPPDEWSDLPRSWRDRQLAMLAQYDDTAIWQGNRGTTGNPALPPENRLLPPTLELIRQGMWPQYQVGAYPYCFRLTECTPGTPDNPPKYQMGQAPGTHWYHAHKHGSTAINVYNGMAGAFIIEGEYDDALARIYPNLKQQVLLVQNYADSPPLMRNGDPTAVTKAIWVNGQSNPVISMRPGEIQLWRLINASVRAVATLAGFTPAAGTTGAGPEMRQIAQDGVQFRYENYRDQPRLTAGVADASRQNSFAAGNRVDLLVKAPSGNGTWQFALNDTAQFSGFTPRNMVQVQVGGTPVSMDFPTEANYPAFPSFLADIPAGEARIHRTLDFGWEAGRSVPAGNAQHRAPVFMIDGRQFEGNRYDQTMILGDVEEWTLLNTTASIAHPFHIHVNPFQVIEIYDPNTDTRYAPQSNFLWQDTIAIPPAKFVNNVMTKAGYVRIRQRFADFTGSYVQHCHMLAHEDRGMMQLLRVIDSRMLVPHH